MKKSAKSSKTKKAAPKAAAKKAVPKAAATRGPAKPVEAPETPPAPRSRYTPAPLRADGWGPFRYPPQ